MNLVHAKCRTRIGHHILNSTLVHRNHISIPLYHIYAIFFGNGFLSLKDTVKFTIFMIDF